MKKLTGKISMGQETVIAKAEIRKGRNTAIKPPMIDPEKLFVPYIKEKWKEQTWWKK